VGRLEPESLPLPEAANLLWQEIVDGTFVWHPPTAEQAAARKERRLKLWKDSHVPWIADDLGALTSWYDDIQDIYSFTRWNLTLSAAKGLKSCLGGAALGTPGGSASMLSCFCPFGKGPGKRGASSAGGLSNLLYGVPLAVGLALLPEIPALMWGLLAGQVTAALFGVGLSLGPIVGASLELTFRGLSELGFPFGADHNKYHELTRARHIEHADRGIGASQYLPWDDRLDALLGTSFALRDVQPVPPVVLASKDYPSAAHVLTDPWGTVKACAKLYGSAVPNALAYVANDMINPAFNDLRRVVGVTPDPIPAEQRKSFVAGLYRTHRQQCMRDGFCFDAAKDFIHTTEWLLGRDLPTEAETLAAGMIDAWYGGLFRPVV
jgi:hypothetical protein